MSFSIIAPGTNVFILCNIQKFTITTIIKNYYLYHDKIYSSIILLSKLSHSSSKHLMLI